MKLAKFGLAVCFAFLFALHAKAGLAIPYTPDGDTLHLWHFDDPTNGLIIADAVTNDSITLTNFGQPTLPPFTNIFLSTNGDTAALHNVLNILPDDGASGNGASHAMAAGPPDQTPNQFINPVTGAFTFEAIVNPRGNIFNSAAGSGEWEILSGDNSVGTRGWQFRLQNQAAPVVNFNFISVQSGTSMNVAATLPTSGSDALAVSNWYHVAITYTGNAPTNADIPGVLTFYWTLLDGNRTNADLLQAFTNASPCLLGGTPSPAVGGSERTTHGVGNGGSFQGFIDEVRVSDIARVATDMVFTTNSNINPPCFTCGSEPAASTVVGFGKSLTINSLATGTLPISYQWQKSNTVSGVFENVSGQTNSALDIASVTFNDGGTYRAIASNAAPVGNVVTSTVAQVTIGAAVSELFNTGVDTNGLVDTNLAGLPDLHYTVIQSADINDLGPNAIVWGMSAFPIAANGGAFANIDGVSQWIGTQDDSYTSPNGTYVYRTHFLLDAVDLTQPLTISGVWWENVFGTSILLNGQPTGNTGVGDNAQAPNAFTITNGFVPGVNTLDLVTSKDGSNGGGAYQESAVRVEIQHALGTPLPPGKPVIVTQPASQTVTDGSLDPTAVATFSVAATGRPPLSYQWSNEHGAIPGATNRTLVFVGATSNASPGTNFSVVVSNASGPTTSGNAALTLLPTDQTINLPDFNFTISTNGTANLDLDVAYEDALAQDQNHDALTAPTTDGASTNGATITMNGTIATYTPNPGFTGIDGFKYFISDSLGTQFSGNVIVNVTAQAPTITAPTVSGGKFVFHGSGGTPGGSFHILSSPNISVPLTNWTVISSNVFDSSGNFVITNAIAAGSNQFFIISVP